MPGNPPQQRRTRPMQAHLPSGGPIGPGWDPLPDLTLAGTAHLTPPSTPTQLPPPGRTAREQTIRQAGRSSQPFQLAAAYQQEAARLRAEAEHLTVFINQATARFSQLLTYVAAQSQQAPTTADEWAMRRSLQHEITTLSAQIAQAQRTWREQLDLAAELDDAAQRLIWEQF
jgi:hypothetical protein